MPFPTEAIERFITAGYPILYLISWEEERIENRLKLVGEKLYQGSLNFYTWSCTDGMRGEDGEVKETGDAIQALNKVINDKKSGFYLFKDLHFFLNDPKVIRKLKDVYQKLRRTTKTLLILSPSLILPNELDKEVTVIDVGLPDADEATIVFDSLVKSTSDKIRNTLTSELK